MLQRIIQSARFQVIYKSAYSIYKRYEKYLPLTFFLGGFGWDSLTLTRIDRMSDNLIMFAYLLLAGLSILLIIFAEQNIIQKKILVKYQNWYPLGLQFFLGGLFSGYVVFYFQSAALTKSWIFMGILVVLLVANEFLEKRLNNLYLVFSLYFLAAYSFFIFFIPVIIKVMNVFTYISGVILGLLLTIGFLYIIYKKMESLSKKQFVQISLLPIFLFAVLNFFYYKNWIPPVPLSLKSGAIYHHVARMEDEYILQFEKPQWYQFWKKSDRPFHYSEGDTVFCFTSIFAPTNLTKNCYHHWQKYFPQGKEWITTDRLGYQITGGRRGGYRGYTYKRNVTTGKWRIDVEIEGGALLGRINFFVKPAEDRKIEFKSITK